MRFKDIWEAILRKIGMGATVPQLPDEIWYRIFNSALDFSTDGKDWTQLKLVSQQFARVADDGHFWVKFVETNITPDKKVVLRGDYQTQDRDLIHRKYKEYAQQHFPQVQLFNKILHNTSGSMPYEHIELNIDDGKKLIILNHVVKKGYDVVVQEFIRKNPDFISRFQGKDAENLALMKNACTQEGPYLTWDVRWESAPSLYPSISLSPFYFQDVCYSTYCTEFFFEQLATCFFPGTHFLDSERRMRTWHKQKGFFTELSQNAVNSSAKTVKIFEELIQIWLKYGYDLTTQFEDYVTQGDRENAELLLKSLSSEVLRNLVTDIINKSRQNMHYNPRSDCGEKMFALLRQMDYQNIKIPLNTPGLPANILERANGPLDLVQYAMEIGEAACLGEFFVNEWFDVNKKIPDGSTYLHFAVSLPSDYIPLLRNVIEALVDCGADANARDAKGKTPLQLAILKKLNSIIPMLVRSIFDNPSLHLSAKDGREIHHYVRENYDDENPKGKECILGEIDGYIAAIEKKEQAAENAKTGQAQYLMQWMKSDEKNNENSKGEENSEDKNLTKTMGV